jgi:hypothetical protein
VFYLKVKPAGTSKINQLPLLRSLPVTHTGTNKSWNVKIDMNKIMKPLQPAFEDLRAMFNANLIWTADRKEALLLP